MLAGLARGFGQDARDGAAKKLGSRQAGARCGVSQPGAGAAWGGEGDRLGEGRPVLGEGRAGVVHLSGWSMDRNFAR